MPLPRPRFLELVCGGLGDGGQLAQPLRVTAETVAAGVREAVDGDVELEPRLVAVEVGVAPNVAGEVAEGSLLRPRCTNSRRRCGGAGARRRVGVAW